MFIIYQCFFNLHDCAKVGISHSKKKFIFFNEISLKMLKNAFYFMLKAVFVLKIFKLLSRLLVHEEKQLD